MRISDWSSDVWSSDLSHGGRRPPGAADQAADGSKRESKAAQGRPDQPRRECPAVDPRLPQRPAERHREEGRVQPTRKPMPTPQQYGCHGNSDAAQQIIARAAQREEAGAYAKAQHYA